MPSRNKVPHRRMAGLVTRRSLSARLVNRAYRHLLIPRTSTSIHTSISTNIIAAPPPQYKAEMTESQIQYWKQQQQQQLQQQQNIKVEMPSLTIQPKNSPPSPLPLSSPSSSTPAASYHSTLQQQPSQTSISSHAPAQAHAQPPQAHSQQPIRDVHAEIQLELHRQSQLQALHEHSRQSNTFQGIAPSPQPSWNQNSTTNGPSPSSAPAPLSQTAGLPLHPTPVELQSALTDNTSIPPYGQESSLTTLDPAPAAMTGVNAKISRPYSSSHGRSQEHPSQTYPSSIDEQSSLTELDATTARPLSGEGPVTWSHSGSGAGIGSSAMFGGQPHQQQYQSYPSAIEEQSSLTEIDNLPFPLEAQSSLTEVDDQPYALEEQSALTELDNLPHPLEEQSALTTVDDLPYSLEEQSALTEVGSLPHPLSEQSSLTVLDEPIASSSQQRDAGIIKGFGPKDKATLPSTATTSTASTTAIVTAFSSTSANASTAPSPESPSAASPAMKALADVTAMSFSMSNWTIPSDFPASSVSEENNDRETADETYPTATRHARSPATMIIDTAVIKDEDSYIATTDDTGILIPLTPAATSDPSSRNSPLSTLNSFSSRTRGPAGSTPPIPAPKPVALMTSKTNHPQSGSSGARLTISDEIHLDAVLPWSPLSAKGNVLIPLQNEPELESDALRSEDEITGLGGEGDHDDDDEDEDEDEDEDDMSAFIREIQSTMPLSGPDSGGSSITGSNKDKTLERVKGSDGNGSTTSQLGKDAPKALEQMVPETNSSAVEQDLPTHASSIPDQPNNLPNGELQQLEAIQFEWTFSEAEQALYEKIFGLWERPGEECVSYDIAGKVFMTLGLSDQDLHRVWQLLNPEEKSALTRTQFIAGLHLVNCKLVGYELPADLPDELMMSAAAVGRVVPPARPVQGPSTLPSDYVEPVASSGSDFMHAYNVSLTDYNVEDSPAIPAQVEPRPTEPDTYAPYPHQHHHYQYEQQQQQQQEWATPIPVFTPTPVHGQFMPQYPPSQHAVSDDRDAPVPASRPMTMTIAVPQPSPETPAMPSKPGPHALHDLPDNAPVFISMEDDSLSRSQYRPDSATENLPPSQAYSDILGRAVTPNSVPLAGAASAAVSNVVQNYHSIDNTALYASPPDAWDHDAAPPELDVEGNYIKYSSDFKNDMTVPASVTANHPINPKSGVFYFEITIDQFKGSAISVGIASKSLRKNCQVGWDLNSWGYHSNDGCLYFGNGKQTIEFADKYHEEDVVGCGVNFLSGTVFFTLNGDMMGVAFKFIKDTILLYPAVGLSHAGTVINANFGDQTFLFNIVEYRK
ncbi:hypothetical protein BGZ54_001173, partial [Gamsiella multidivaricata]